MFDVLEVGEKLKKFGSIPSELSTLSLGIDHYALKAKIVTQDGDERKATACIDQALLLSTDAQAGADGYRLLPYERDLVTTVLIHALNCGIEQNIVDHGGRLWIKVDYHPTPIEENVRSGLNEIAAIQDLSAHCCYLQSLFSTNWCIGPDGSLISSRGRIETVSAIDISVRSREHGVPHFHIESADFKASLSIKTCEVIAGKVPSRKLSLIQKWHSRSRRMLELEWNRMNAGNPAVRMIEVD